MIRQTKKNQDEEKSEEKIDDKVVEVKRQGSILKKKRDKDSTTSEQVNILFQLISQKKLQN